MLLLRTQNLVQYSVTHFGAVAQNTKSGAVLSVTHFGAVAQNTKSGAVLSLTHLVLLLRTQNLVQYSP